MRRLTVAAPALERKKSRRDMPRRRALSLACVHASRSTQRTALLRGVGRYSPLELGPSRMGSRKRSSGCDFLVTRPFLPIARHRSTRFAHAMLKGSCLCGGVRYEAEGPLMFMARCHCVQCRKASGAEFATNASVRADTFRVVCGADLLGSYAWSPGQERVFCSRCGSPLFKRAADKPDQVRIRLGGLDVEIEQRPLFHVFVAEKPDWSEIGDGLPCFDTLPAAPST